MKLVFLLAGLAVPPKKGKGTCRMCAKSHYADAISPSEWQSQHKDKSNLCHARAIWNECHTMENDENSPQSTLKKHHIALARSPPWPFFSAFFFSLFHPRYFSHISHQIPSRMQPQAGKKHDGEENDGGSPFKKKNEGQASKGRTAAMSEVLLLFTSTLPEAPASCRTVYLTFFTVPTGAAKADNLILQLKSESPALSKALSREWVLTRRSNQDGTFCDSVRASAPEYNRARKDLQSALESLLQKKTICQLAAGRRPITESDILEPLGLIPTIDEPETHRKLEELSYNVERGPRGRPLYLACSFEQAAVAIDNIRPSIAASKLAEPMLTMWQLREGITAFHFTVGNLQARICLDHLVRLCAQPKFPSQGALFRGIIGERCILLAKGRTAEFIQKHLEGQNKRQRISTLPPPAPRERKARDDKSAVIDMDDF